MTRSFFQDTLTITRDDVSYIDYGVPKTNTVQLAFDYSPVWVSFRPTFWVSLIAVIGCVAAVVVKKRQLGDKASSTSKKDKHSNAKSTSTVSTQPSKGSEAITSTVTVSNQPITAESVREFTDAYDERKQLNTELKSIDVRAQKGKIPRRQYKVQRRGIEIRLETLKRNTNKLKASFRSSGGIYADLMKQLDSAEADLTKAEEDIKNLESSQSKGEISLETYKRTIGDYQKHRDKAESTINGILLRLREKAR